MGESLSPVGVISVTGAKSGWAEHRDRRSRAARPRFVDAASGRLPAVSETNQAIDPELSAKRLAGTFPGNLGIELTEISDERVRGRMPVDQRHLHPEGYVHGGAWVAFADTVAAWGTLRHLPPGRGFTTVELKINVLASATDGDQLTAVGEQLHGGSRTQVWQVQVFRGERLAAHFVCTQIIL
jgi:1,4-dihydroxy-2-naphthoyl-CoA hydrolase